MKNILKNYKSSLILILSIILGTCAGLIFKDKMTALSPLGDLFLNMLLVIIVPLIFLTISTSIGKMKSIRKVGKILGSTLLVFIVTSLISVFIGFASSKSFKLVTSENAEEIKNALTVDASEDTESVNYLERTIDTISTNDFSKLLSKDNMIALIVFSIVFGIAINMSKEKGKDLLNVLDSASIVIQNVIKLIMYYAPIGLFCYIGALVGTFGSSLAKGYGKTFVIYTITCLIVYFVIYSLYVLVFNGKTGLKKYWKAVIAPSLTAVGTCSSAASIAVNVKASKELGVSDEVANTAIPLGTSFHKDGSIIGSVFKIMFLVYLFNSDVSNIQIIVTSLIATLLVTAVPIGGGTISEMLIITSLGFPLGSLPILTIIATIIDAPATLLNVVGDTASSTIIEKLVNKKRNIN